MLLFNSAGSWIPYSPSNLNTSYVPIQPTSTDPNYMPFVEGGGPAVFLQKENTKLIFSTIFR